MPSQANLTQKYRLLDAQAAVFADKMRSARAFERDVFLPYAYVQADLTRELQLLQAKVQQLAQPDQVYALINGQISNFLESMHKTIKSAYERPSRYISQWTQNISYLCRKDSRMAQERAEILLARIAQADKLWQVVKTWLKQVDTLYLREASDTCVLLKNTLLKELSQVEQSFFGLHQAQVLSVSHAIKSIIILSQTWQNDIQSCLYQRADIKESMTSETDCIPFAEDYYRELLSKELGVDLDQLLRWHLDELEKTRADVFTIAAKLPIADAVPRNMQDVHQLLLKYAGPKSNPQEMFLYGQEYLTRARIACQDFVSLPKDETCLLTSVPEQLKFSYPWGGYGGGCPLRRPLLGEYFLNDINFTAVTDGWLKMMAVHEAYPGHHVQFIRTNLDRLPETVKMGSLSVPITEGTAHRSERVFEFAFEEDPFYPLFVAYRRHHTAVRIKAELSLRYHGYPIGDAVKIYMDELGFDHHTARGQVRAQETMQGYFNCYYYGMKRIADLEATSGYSTQEFTEYLFSAGRISLELFAQYLVLDKEDKLRYSRDFASLLQFGA